MINYSEQTCFNFTNLFSRLKYADKAKRFQYATISTCSQRKRPKSMYIPRIKIIQQKNVMNHTSYNRKWVSISSKQSSSKARCFTEGAPSIYTTKHEDKQELKYLPINNYCLKKIHVPKNTLVDTPNKEQNKIKIKQIEMKICNSCQQKSYIKKSLLTGKKAKKIRNILQPCDISARIQGRKIF